MKKKILIAESGSGYGGSAKYLANLLPLIDHKRFQIEIAAYGSGPFIQRIKGEGARVHYFPRWRFPWNFLEGSGRPLTGKIAYLVFSLLQLAVLIPWIAFWLARKRFELIHINNEIISHFPLLLAARLACLKTICHMHGWRQLTATEKWASRFVGQFAAVTQSGADFYSWQLNGRNVLGIPNGISPDEEGLLAAPDSRRNETRKQLGISEREILAVMVGRLIPLKGHFVFFQALAKARKNFPLLRGLAVGNDPSPRGEYRKKLDEELSALGIQDQVQFLSWQDHMGPIYEASDIILQPSVDPESFGYVALEGMLAGKPVIASRIGGLRDVVKEGETGFLVGAGDPGELECAISRIAGDRNLGFRLGEQGRERAKTVFTMERNAGQVMELYRTLLDAPQENGRFKARQFASRIVKEVIVRSGSIEAIRQTVSSKVPILMYHRISAEKDPFFPAISYGTFLSQMEYVKRHYRIISMDQLMDRWKAKEPVPRGSLAVTFDDGHAPTWLLAYPVLQKLEIPVTMFLATNTLREGDFIWTDLLRWWFKLTSLDSYAVQLNGTYGEWKLDTASRRLTAASEVSEKLKTFPNIERRRIMEQLGKELGIGYAELPRHWSLTLEKINHIGRGGVQFGAHTQTHPILTRISEEEARSEIFGSKKELEAIFQEPVRHFAYPNGEAGDFDETHERLIAEAGFDSASSSILGLNDSGTNPYALRRVYAAEEPIARFACRLAGVGS